MKAGDLPALASASASSRPLRDSTAGGLEFADNQPVVCRRDDFADAGQTAGATLALPQPGATLALPQPGATLALPQQSITGLTRPFSEREYRPVRR